MQQSYMPAAVTLLTIPLHMPPVRDPTEPIALIIAISIKANITAYSTDVVASSSRNSLYKNPIVTPSFPTRSSAGNAANRNYVYRLSRFLVQIYHANFIPVFTRNGLRRNTVSALPGSSGRKVSILYIKPILFAKDVKLLHVDFFMPFGPIQVQNFI
jgi:hypothetical protein